MDGQKTFLRKGLMEYGSIFGHGAYLGPDYTADYLRRAADRCATATAAPARTARSSARSRTSGEPLRLEHSDTLTYTAPQAEAFRKLRAHYRAYFGNPTTEFGLRPRAIDDPVEIHELTAYFSWAAWAASAERPGHNYSYTNNWPPEPLVDNKPTANVIVWSVISLIALLGGVGPLVRRLRALELPRLARARAVDVCRSARRATSPSPRRNAPAPGSCS